VLLDEVEQVTDGAGEAVKPDDEHVAETVSVRRRVDLGLDREAPDSCS